jgi:hypothetical protein
MEAVDRVRVDAVLAARPVRGLDVTVLAAAALAAPVAASAAGVARAVDVVRDAGAVKAAAVTVTRARWVPASASSPS